MSISLTLQVSDEDVDLLRYIVLRPRKQAYRDGAPVMGAYYGRRRQALHRVVMRRALGGERISRTIMVDHINGDPLDNRRENLRLATARQNAANRRIDTSKQKSKYKGVTSDRAGKWKAQASEPDGEGGYRRITIGRYPTEKEAALAYNAWMLRTHGEFALLNVINELPDSPAEDGEFALLNVIDEEMS